MGEEVEIKKGTVNLISNTGEILATAPIEECVVAFMYLDAPCIATPVMTCLMDNRLYVPTISAWDKFAERVTKLKISEDHG